MGKKFTRIVFLCGLLTVILSATAWAVSSLSTAIPMDTDEAAAELAAANVIYPVEGGNLYFDATNGEITDCDETVTSAEIPSAIYGVPVTKIGFYSFQNCSQLTEIIIPNSVTDLSSGAFYGCKKLTSIVVPNSLKSIGGNAFNSCESLASIVISDSITSINMGAFSSCTSLTDVYYAGTLQQWISISISSYNDPLITANIHFESEIPTPTVEQFRINSVTVSDNHGRTLNAIPADSFFATVSVTSLSSLSESPLVLFAAYTEAGQYQGMSYAFVKVSPGGTVEFTLPFNNRDGEIGQLKAFAVTSFEELIPLTSAVSFPAA